jgi:hypothetical protein
MFGRGKREKAQQLMATGAKGIGTVMNVQDTGMTVNDNPRVKMTFQIEPLDGGPAFQAQKTKTVSRVQIPRNGDRYPCWYDAADPSTWMYATIHDAQGQAQIRALFGAQAETLTGMGGMGGMPVANAIGGAMAVATPPMAATAAPGAGDPVDRLKKLDDLHKAGVLSDTEYSAKKAEILSEI